MEIVDLASAKGKKELAELMAKADVLVQNLKPGALDRLGFGVEMLRKTHPRLIACSISGYGESGPLAERKAYDLLIQANPASARSLAARPNRRASASRSSISRPARPRIRQSLKP